MAFYLFLIYLVNHSWTPAYKIRMCFLYSYGASSFVYLGSVYTKEEYL